MSQEARASEAPREERDLWTLLAATTPADRVIYALVALLLLAAATAAPLLDALEPRIAVTRAWQSTNMQLPDDPWGRPFLFLDETDLPDLPPDVASLAPFYSYPYSRGRDGLDQRGRGDDLLVLPGGDWRLVLSSAEASLVLLGLAVGLGAAWELTRFLRRLLFEAPWAGPELEALRAAGAALPAGLLGAAAGAFLPRLFGSLQPPVAAAEKALVVPFPLAAGGGLWMVVTLALLWLRARPGLEPSAEPERPCSQPPAPPIEGEGGTP